MTSKADILDQLRERLEKIEQLDAEMREALRTGDAAAIDRRTARLQTLALEFKTLQLEYTRLPDTVDEGPTLERAHGNFRSAALRVARKAAIGGGLLHQVATLSGRLLEAVNNDLHTPYERSGRRAPIEGAGLKLREMA